MMKKTVALIATIMAAQIGAGIAPAADMPISRSGITGQRQCAYTIRPADAESASIAPGRVCDDGRFTVFTFDPDGILPLVYQVVTVGDEQVDMPVNTHYSPEGYLVAETLHPTWHVRAGNRVVEVIQQPANTAQASNMPPSPPPLPTGGVLSTDRYIPALLETPIDTRLSGRIVAIVSQSVYSWGGNTLVVPEGSKAIGFYGVLNRPGQTRVDICITGVILPGGSQLKPADAHDQTCIGAVGEITGAHGLPVSPDLTPDFAVPSGTRILIRPLVDLQVE